MPEYKCEICQDTYWVYPVVDKKTDYSRVIRCKCVAEQDKKDRWTKMLRYCQLPSGSESQTFETFSDRNNASLKEAKESAIELANNSNQFRWLTLVGKTDCGKSHLAKAITRQWLNRGVPARYGFVPDLLLDLKNGFDKQGQYSFEMTMDSLKNIPLLVLDDLGTEKLTDWAMETIQTIINHRYENQLHLVVTSNRPLDSLLGNKTPEALLASQRIASRLQRELWCKVIVIDASQYNAGRTK